MLSEGVPGEEDPEARTELSICQSAAVVGGGVVQAAEGGMH